MPAHADNSDVWLYDLEYATADDTSEPRWQNVCAKNGAAQGIFVNGRWRSDGSWQQGGYTFSCAQGVIAKCVRSWGYKPWKTVRTAIDQSIDLRPLHQACTRAARADYCGNGTSYTRDGTRIDMFDTYGLNVREPDTGFVPEAGFSEHGAEWAVRTRWPAGARKTHDSLLLTNCHLLRNAPTGDSALIEVWSAYPPDHPAHHATQAELTQSAHASREEYVEHGADRALELRRTVSLATGAVTMLRPLLDDVRDWLLELAGHRGIPSTFIHPVSYRCTSATRA